LPTRRFEALEPERRAHLLACAAAEFAEHGFEAASFNRIIERAGVSKGSFYYYFEDKADLYATVLRDAVGRLMAACGVPRPAPDAEAFWAEVRRIAGRAFHHYRSDPHIAGLVRSLVRDGLQPGPVAEIRATSTAWFSALVLAGQAIGAVRADLPLPLVLAVATSVAAGVDQWLAEHVAGLTDGELDRAVDQIVDLYRRMAAPKEPR
jgi:AcrR family transcriptional regulator